MSVSDNEAEKKFWRTPELVESLLHFLDPPSILELGQVHPLTTGIMQGISTWNRFIRKSCPFPPADHQTSHTSFEERTEEKVAELRPILGVLQLIDSPLPHLLDLLEIICQRFPPTEVRRGVVFGDVKVTCPTHKVHNVSALGFVLLGSWLKVPLDPHCRRLDLSLLTASKGSWHQRSSPGRCAKRG